MLEAHESQFDGKWVPNTELPKRGYWFGSEYRGNYYKDLFLNLMELEAICRENHFPPIVLISEKWLPPAATEPEMVAPGVSALKGKLIQPLKRANVPELHTPTLSVIPLEEEFANSKLGYIPIGWQLRIKDGKIIDEIERRSPSITQKERKRLFADRMNKQIRSALLRVGLLEAISARMADPIYSMLGTGVMLGSDFMISTPFFAKDAGLLEKSSITAIIRNLFGASLDAGDKQDKQAFGKAKAGTRNIPMKISNQWRAFYFPERYDSERHGPTVIQKVITRVFPTGIGLEPFWYLAESLIRHNEKLVQF